MHDLLRALSWLVCALGVLTLAAGVLTLANRRAAYPWLRRRVAWKRWGWAQIVLGVGAVLAELPWLLDDTSSPIFALNIAGAALLVAGSMLGLRAQLPRV